MHLIPYTLYLSNIAYTNSSPGDNNFNHYDIRPMNEQQLLTLLQQVQAGSMSTDQAVDKLRRLPMEVLDSARLDHHRQLRTGLPEAVFGANKTVDQLIEILGAMLKSQSVVLATRVDPEKGTTGLREG